MAPSGCYLRVDDLTDPSGLYELGDRIAEGTYGEIYVATEKSSGTQVAIKIVDNTEETFPDIEEEYRILKDLSVHQNIPKLHGIFKKAPDGGNTEQIWIAMEYCSGGSVTDLVKRLKDQGQAMKEDHIAYILYHTVQAACHLHRNHVIHRDIKGQNILLTDAADVKLVDFGISRHLKSTMDRLGTSIGTPYWMAPEVILCDQLPEREYDIRADVWSLGITAIELGDGLPPLADIHPVRAMFQITRNPPPSLSRPVDWSQTYIDFIVECLEKNQENRPLMEELVNHPFLSSVEPRLAAIQEELAGLLRSAGPASSSQPAQVTSKAGYLRTRPHSKSLEILQDDLAALEDVTEDAVLNLLEKRFHRGIAYTFVADVLIAVNPYSEKPLYDRKTHEAYCSRARSDNAPHVFAVADRAHQDMAHHQRGQTIIFTGETGAGKTFNARMALDHLCHLGKSEALEEKVRGAGFIIELLGSAATSTNPASTRHVRFFETTFTKTGRLSGVIIWIYMLERWRITNFRRSDGTFNALYAYFYGLQESGRLGIYKLQNRDDYNFLPKHRYLDPVDSANKFKEFERVLDSLEISKDKQETVRKVMAAIILLGEVGFEDNDDGDISVTNKDLLGTVSYLLSVDEAKLTWSLQHRCRITTDGDTVKEAKTAAEAAASRDALTRLLYGRLVDSIVNWINASFTLTRLLFGESNTVGLLDLYGFECRETNYLEELVVNSFNEQLQSFFNQSVFQWEMEDFRNDDLEVPPYTFTDNSVTIDMLMKKGEGLLALLDESTLSEKASDGYFIENCKDTIENRHFIPEKDGFAIAHYAGKVSYSNKDIIEKNKDHLDPEVFDTLRQSENPYLAPMFLLPLTKTGNLTVDREQAQRESGGKGRKAKLSDSGAGNKRFDTRSRGRLSQTSLVLLTQSSCYRFSAMEVMQNIINTTAHFVRCVRPNGENAVDTWETGLVSNQLKCMQTINTIAIRKTGYSQRIDFAEFLRRYQFLAFDFDETVEVTRENCRLLMVRLKMDEYLIGREKIFIKYFIEEYMSRLYEHEVKKIAKVQAMIRAFLVRRRRRDNQPLDVTRYLASGDQQFLKRPSGGTTGARYRRRSSALSPMPASLGRKIAAEKIQQCFRRWRGRTLFQQLQRYRAAKHHDLIVFSHQVHIYGQEFFYHLTCHKKPVPLESIVAVDRETARSATDARLKMLKAVRKIPISRSLGDFVDTLAMCTPHQPSAAAERRASSPDTAQRHNLSPHTTPQPCPTCQRSGAAATPRPSSPRPSPSYPDPGQGSRSSSRSGAVSPQFEFELPQCSAAPVSEARALFDRQTGPQPPLPSFSAPPTPSYPGQTPPYLGRSHDPTAAPPGPVPAAARPAPVTPSYNRFAGSGHSSGAQRGPASGAQRGPASGAQRGPASGAQRGPASAASTAGGSMWGMRWAASPSTPTAPFVQELQEKAGKPDDDDDAPPFNFQGMLKKTNVARESMKRRNASQPPGSVVISPYGKPTGYNAKKMAMKTPSRDHSSRGAGDAGTAGTPASGPGRRTEGLEPTSSQNGNHEPDRRGSVTPQIVFEGEEVEL